LQLRRVKGFRRAEIATLAKRNFDPASTVVSDGLRCFAGVGIHGQYVFVDNTAVNGKAAGATWRLF
jgi:hypothetical protein